MAIFAAVLSAVVWGGGQLYNKQRIKALFFFLIQCIFIGIELATGSFAVITGQAEAHFRNSGFFTSGLWGIITLGEIYRESAATLVFDHSSMLMLTGLVSIVILVCFLIFYIWNIRDAYITRKNLQEGYEESSLAYVKRVADKSFAYIAISPGLILLSLFSFVPIFFAFLVAFTNFNLNNLPPRNLIQWVGFQTFRDVLNIPVWNQTLIGIFIWTTIWAFAATFSGFVVGFFQALLLSSKLVKFPKVWRGLFILPWAIPGLLSMMLFRNFFVTNGVVNNLLMHFGLIDMPISFFGSVGWSRGILIVVNVWLAFPYFMALVSGVMSSLNPETYEAAAIDGATAVQQMRYLTIPSIIAAVAPLLIMSVASNFNNFGMIYFITGGGPANVNYIMAGSTDILITWVFRLTVDHRMYNFASVMSVFIFVIVASVSGYNMWRTRAFRED